MSLAEAILDVAQEMERAGERLGDTTEGIGSLLYSYARQLRRLLLVNKPTSLVAAVAPEWDGGCLDGNATEDPLLPTMDPAVQAAVARQRAKRKLAEEQRRDLQVSREDQDGADMRVLVDGPYDGDLVRVGAIPVSAYTPVAGEVYQLLEDGKLHHSPEQTERFRGTQPKPVQNLAG